jgi:hypothetical protein
MPIGNPALSDYILELGRLARRAEDLAATPGARSVELHEVFTQAGAVAARGALASQAEAIVNMKGVTQ